MRGLNRTSVATAICAAVVILTTPVRAISDPKSPNVGLPSSPDQFEPADKVGSTGKAESPDMAQPAHRGQSARQVEPSRHLRHRCAARRSASGCGARYSDCDGRYDVASCDAGCSPRRYRSRCVDVSSSGYDGGGCSDYVGGCDDYAFTPAPYYSADWVEAPYYGVVWGYAPTYEPVWDLSVVPAPASELIAVPIVAAPSPWGW
jgi:hypothetical protein